MTKITLPDPECIVEKGSFGWALNVLFSGGRVARAGWNGKGMFVYWVRGSTFQVNRDPLMSALGEGTRVKYLPHIDIKTSDGSCVPWNPSQADMHATDWERV